MLTVILDLHCAIFMLNPTCLQEVNMLIMMLHLKTLASTPKGIPVFPFRDLAVFIAQKEFEAYVEVKISPMLTDQHSAQGCSNGVCTLINALIMFVNSVTKSRVIFQGYSYEICSEKKSAISNNHPIQLDIIFYETPSHNGSPVDKTSPVIIRNTSFIQYSPWTLYPEQIILHILQLSKKLKYEVKIEDTAWCNNTIDHFEDRSWIFLMHAQSLLDEQPLHLRMKNIYVQNNVMDSFRINQFHQLSSESLLQFVNADVSISGTCYIGQNGGGSAINAVSSNLTITDDVTISGGHAYKGGGIRLDAFSYLFLKEPLNATFINNRAQQGSAIYAPAHTSTRDISDIHKTISAIQILPIDYYTDKNISSIDINITIHGTDQQSPILYAPNFNFFGKQITPLFLFDSDSWDSVNNQYVYTTLIDTILKAENVDKYGSLSNGICIEVKGQQINCIYIDHFHHDPIDNPYDPYIIEPTLPVYPGQSAVSLPCDDNKKYQIFRSGLIVEVPCKAIDNEFFSTSLIGRNLSLSFNNVYGLSYPLTIAVSNLESSTYISFVSVKIHDLCPVGFNLTGGVCNCTYVLMNSTYHCDINTLTITSPHNYWTSYIPNYSGFYHNTQYVAILFSTSCPPNYCRNLTSFRLNDSLSHLACLHNRSGVLCSECRNQSVMFGSDACADCSNFNLLTLPVYALAGLLLVVILYLLHLTVATGTINGVIFFANMLSRSMEIFSRGSSTSTLHIIISLLNLNLGFPLCFYSGMTTAGKAGLQFVFPVYVWSIVLGLILASKCSVTLSNAISHSSVQVLATLLYLSFSKLTSTAIYILSSSTVYFIVYEETGTDRYWISSSNNVTVWYYDGTNYGNKVHGALVFLAVLFAVFFVLPYSFLLTFSQFLTRFRIVNKFRPFLDAYGGPFKDKWRFWFGLRLWITAILLSVNGALQGSDSIEMLVTHFAVLLVFILLQAHIRPFRNQLVGAMDLFFMLNYMLVAVFYLQFAESKPAVFLVAYIIFLSSAILMLVLIVLAHMFYFWVYLKNVDLFTSWKVKLLKKFKDYEIVEPEARDEDADDVLFQAAEERDRPVDTY